MKKSGPKARKTTTRPPTRMTFGLLAAIAVMIGLAMWRLDRSGSAPFGIHLFGKHSAKSAEHARLDPAEQRRLADKADRYRVGDVFTYALGTEAAVDVTDGGRMYHMQGSGDWKLRVLEVERGHTLLSASLEGARLLSTQRAKDGEEQFKLVERALAEPVFFTLDARGRVEDVRFAADAPRAASDLVRSFLALSQAVAPDKGDKPRWTAVESDASGKYLAEYTRASATRWSKQKLKYTDVIASSVTSEVQLDVVTSEGDLDLDARGVLKNARIVDGVRSTAQMMPEMKSTTMLTLTRKTQTVDLVSVAALRERAARLQPYALYDTPVTKDDVLAVERAKVRGRNLNDFLLELEALPEFEQLTDDQRARERRAFIELAALLRIDDKAVDQALATIIGGSGVSSILWDALGSAGTPHAQAALRQLIDDRQFKDNERRSQLIGLSFVNEPTDDTLKFLSAHMDDPLQGQQARFGFGTAMNHLSRVDPKRAQHGHEQLVAQLHAATTDQDKSDYLLAIGNAGMPDSKPLIESYLGDGSFLVRGAAAQALRYMPGDDVADTLLNLIKNDPIAFVRAEALDAVSDHRPTKALIDAVFDVAMGDESDLPRKKAMETAMVWRTKYPPVEEAFAAFEAKTRDQSATP